MDVIVTRITRRSVIFEEVKKQSNPHPRIIPAECDRVPLGLPQLLADLAQEVQLQVWIAAQQAFEREQRQAIGRPRAHRAGEEFDLPRFPVALSRPEWQSAANRSVSPRKRRRFCAMTVPSIDESLRGRIVNRIVTKH